MKISAVTPVLLTPDIERTLAFYRDVLGFQVAERIPPKGDPFRIRLRADDVELVIERGSHPSSRPVERGVVLTFATDDLLAFYASFKEKTTDASTPLFTAVGTMVCSVTDPDGRAVSLEQPVKTLCMTKERLLDLVRDSHARFDRIVGQLSDEQMLESSAQGIWSAKDIFAHMSAWEERCLGFLDADARGETPDFITWADVDRVNQRFYEENRHKTLDEVRAHFLHSFQAMLDRIESLSEEDLISPDRYPWLKETPLWLLFAYNTFDHYPRHGDRIRAWIGDATLRNG